MRNTLCSFVQLAHSDDDIVEAGTGQDGLQLCRERRPHLVLMDVRLPDSNGIELTAQVKAMLPETVIIIVSSHGEAIYVEHARANGASDYVDKNRIYQDLLPAIARAIDNRENQLRTGNPGGIEEQP